MEDKLILRTNELDNAIDYLEKAAYYFNNRNDSHWFKWLMISLHGALYGFGVCAIKGTNPSLRVLDELSKKQIRETLPLLSERYLGFDQAISKDHQEILADEHMLIVLKTLAENNLNKIWDVLDKCEDPDYMLQNTESKVLKRTPKQIKAIEKLINYRNDFAHFKPRALSVITSSEEWIIEEVITVIKFLALESGNIFYFEEHSCNEEI
ncbi:hypothetical protein C0966_04480 [Bacillus methanolicus]|uniref:hypothetical protein n=1 Tax=Bacillus methanolicus TaxID=1471 RepID=UPI00237FFFEB|nr:hypothetical protein [Bacillus methanolicus]MDE3838645.1 hypothetical protein [Bacillus methanolicus]